MGQPSWRTIATIRVPGGPGRFWTEGLDYVSPGKLYKITVNADANGEDQTWEPEAGAACSADGNSTLTRKEALIIDSCAPGSLIAKVGGSSADTKPDKDKLILLPVGRHCVFSVTELTKCGSLYLGLNDVPASMGKVGGHLEVTISESL